jgi:hypothetical protein
VLSKEEGRSICSCTTGGPDEGWRRDMAARERISDEHHSGIILGEEEKCKGSARRMGNATRHGLRADLVTDGSGTWRQASGKERSTTTVTFLREGEKGKGFSKEEGRSSEKWAKG